MWYLAVFLMALGSASTAWADEAMYKCEDGMFTNRADLLCQPYQPKGNVLIAPPGASFAAIKTLFGEPAQASDSSPKVKLQDSLHVCNLYKEWIAMNAQSGGGVTFQNTQDVPRWITLSRIFTAIPAPQQCP